MMPKISVILPVYNGATFLPETITNVLDQTFKDFEFLIINDGSTDNSEKIIRDYQKRDSRIVHIKNETNLGLQKTLNKGIEASLGKYIARIDNDDIWSDADKLQKQFNFLEKNPDFALVGTSMETMDENGRKIEEIYFPQADEEVRKHLLFSSQFAHPSVMIKKQALEKVGFYSAKKKHRHVEDYELWLRLGSNYKLANLPDICLKYRINSGGVSLKNEFKQRLAWLRLTAEYAKHYPHSQKAFLAKLISLPVPRRLADIILKKIPLFSKLYFKVSGIRKS